MNEFASRVGDMAARQRGVVATWQLAQLGWSRDQVKSGLRGLRRLYRGVCATGDVDELGWFMAAALAMGPTGAISHSSALMLMELRPQLPGDVHVSYVGGHRDPRPGLVPHRRRAMETGTFRGIPVTSPTQSLQDAGLAPHEAYRALEQAQRRGLQIDALNDVVRLRRAIRGTTRSDTEARLIWLCHEHRLPLPRVNQRLNGFEADFHWPAQRLVVEVDGFEHHRERRQFNEDRRRGLVHAAAGWDLLRISADHVYDEPALVLAALAAYRVQAGGG